MEQVKRHNQARLIIGIALIIIGALMLGAQFLGKPLGHQFWPFLLIIGGILFYAGYFSGQKLRGSEGLLFPGTYLIVIGLLFVVLNIIGWDLMSYLWPTFIFAVALSFIAMYIFTPAELAEQRKGYRSPILIMTVLSAAFYCLAANASILWPLILIAVGLIIIISGFRKKQA